MKLWNSTKLNSSNFFFLGFAYSKNFGWSITYPTNPESIQNDSKSIFAGWGMIRNLNAFQYIQFNLGARYTFETKQYSPHIQFKYGFTILTNQKEKFYQQFK